jgi:hypothetical protein
VVLSYSLAIMGMPCGVFVLPCYHGYALWCVRTPLLWVCLAGSTKTPQDIPMIAREYENTTRHTHDSKGVRKHHKTYLSWVYLVVFSYSLAIMGMPCGVFVLPCYHGYVLLCFRTPLLSWVCLVVGSTKTPQSIPMIAREYENTTRHTHDSKGVRKHHKTYP